jgi:integrase/recombinase XerC
MITTATQFRVAPVITTWSQAFEAWLRLDGRKSSLKPLREKSIQACLQDIRHFSKYFEQAAKVDFTPDQLTQNALLSYFSSQSAAPASTNRRLASLRTLTRWSISVGLLHEDPTVRIPRIEISSLPPRAKDDLECQRLAKVAKRAAHITKRTPQHDLLGLRDQVIWELMYDAGLRIGSVAALDIEGLHLDEGWIAVEVKGGKIGEISIPQRLCRLIRAWLRIRPGIQHGAVITDGNGKRITTGQIRRRLYAIGSAAGVDVKPHDLRHTYIYRLVDKALEGNRPLPAALDIARQQACHSDVRTTQGYIRARRSDIQKIVEGI